MARWAEFEWGASSSASDAEVSPDWAADFSSSMPPGYRVLFDPRTTRKHAAVCSRRDGRPAHVEVWRTLADGSVALCVVADDRPGLLSAIAAALVSHRLDVITALVFSRTAADGRVEAVDLVWVRRANSGDRAPIDDEEAVSVGEVLSAILSGSITVEQIASDAAVPPASPDRRLVVRFEDGLRDDELASLFVEAADRPGILLSIAHEVFQQGAQVVRSLVRTAGGRAYNHFELAEFSGASLSRERREQIRAAVHAALSLREAD